jgi:ferritin
MLSEKLGKLLNEQITKEAASFYLYLGMASWCESRGLGGAGQFLRGHADEELNHMKKIYHYVLERGVMAELGDIQKPRQDYNDILELFQDTLKHEQFITRSINEIVDVAFAEKDFATFNFLQWFVAEQHEEENLVQTIVDKIQLIGLEGQGLYLIDKEIDTLVQNPEQTALNSQGE